MSVFPNHETAKQVEQVNNVPQSTEEEGALLLRKKAYHELVEEWANCPSSDNALFLLPVEIRNPEFSKRKIKAGFCENIAAYIKAYKLDSDMNGALQPYEIKEKEEEAKAVVEGYLNLLVNFGVIGALFFSVLFSWVISDLPVADESAAFFGDYIVRIFKYVFYVCINISVVLSIYIISRSVALYKHLGFWMPDIQAQLAWIQKISITSTILYSLAVLNSAAIAIPFGAAVSISPIAGLISAISVVTMFILVRDIMLVEEKSEYLLQQSVKRILREQRK